MNCQKCGNQVEANMKFCAKCGTPVVQQPIQQTNVPQMPVQQTVNVHKSAPSAQNPKKKNKNLPLIITAIVLVVAVIASAIAIIPGFIRNKSEIDGATEYIEDFPTLKQQTEFLVYDEEKFPSEKYEIKVERVLMGGMFKGETIIEDVSIEHTYSIDFKEDGNYRITLKDITAQRTQATSEQTEADNSTEIIEIIIIIDVVVDDDDPEALDKVDINSNPVDEPVESPTDTSKPTDTEFIEATDNDFEEFEKMLTAFMTLTIDTFDCKTATVDDIMNFVVGQTGPEGYNYFFKNETGMITTNGFETNCFVMKESEIKWICESIFNINYSQDYIDDQVFILKDGNVYRPIGNSGMVLRYSATVAESNVVNDKYELVADMYGTGWDGREYNNEYIKSLKITAEIKVIDGERYWSIYKIENYDKENNQQDNNKPETKSEFLEATQVDFDAFWKKDNYDTLLNSMSGILTSGDMSAMSDVEFFEKYFNYCGDGYGFLYYYYYGDVPELQPIDFKTKPDPRGNFDPAKGEYSIGMYYRYPAEKLDWIMKNIFNITPTHSDGFISDKNYYEDGYYYLESVDGLGGPYDVFYVEDYIKLDDGKYKAVVSCRDVFEEEEYAKAEFVIGLKEIDGKREWVFYKINVVDKNGEVI